MVPKKNRLDKCLYHHSEWNLTASNFHNVCVVKITWISASVLYYAVSQLYILTELRANDVTFISVDRQKLDLSKYTYGTVNPIFVEIQLNSTNIKKTLVNQNVRIISKDSV